jgi:hypothetical protein
MNKPDSPTLAAAMTRVTLDDQDDAVKQFVLSLSAHGQESVVELQGKEILRVVPATNGKGADDPDWTDAKNDRRCELIDKEIHGSLAPGEQRELEDLQEQMLRYRHRVAPLPLAYARELLEELEKKAAQASGPTA